MVKFTEVESRIIVAKGQEKKRNGYILGKVYKASLMQDE